jgi:GT2 family glycosyltransferase
MIRKANDVVNDFSIHYITPGRPDKNFGKAINDIVKGLPDNDWICLRDIDTLVLDHSTLFKQLDEIVKLHGKEYDMFGAITNDLGLKRQLYKGELSRTYNLEDHHAIAKKLSEEKYSEVTYDKNSYIGGFFMLFSKAIWQKIGGLPEGLVIKGKFIDYIFSKMVKKAGGRIGICQGVYIYHFCRYGKPRKDISHLYNSKK